MRRLQDMSFLLLSGFLYLFYREPDSVFILAFLLSLILCCISYFADSAQLHCILCLLFFGFTVFIPEFCCFFPAVFYILLRKHLWIILFPGIFSFVFAIQKYAVYSRLFAVWGIIFFAVSVLLWKRTETTEQLEQNILKLRDDSTENHLLLAEKNRVLAEKQNYEIYAATLKERNRIAREIHDNVGHLLSRSILLVGAAKTVNTAPSVSSLLEHLDETLNQAMDSVRTSVHDLHDESVDLKDTTEHLLRNFTFCPISLTYDMGVEIPRDVKYCFISILKEALANIMKHSNASRAAVTLREHPGFYQLCVENNGRSNSPSSSSGGIGISNMRDRLSPLRGTLQISRENGFHLFISIPKEKETDE